MDIKFPVLRGRYLNDLLAQPQAIADTISGLAGISAIPNEARRASRIVLTGMGSSLHALQPLLIRLIGAGRVAIAVETAELVYSQYGLIDPQTLVVMVSQSGRSAETVALLDRMDETQNRSFVIGVTNVADSPLATRADFLIPLAAGPEFSVSCKTYLATLIALEWLADALIGENLSAVIDHLLPVSEVVADYLARGGDHVNELIERLRGIRHLFLTGRGSSLAAVNTGALILKESTRFHAEGMSSPAFRHGPLEMVNPELFAMVFAGDPATAPLSERLVRDITAVGGKASLVAEDAAPGVFRLPKVTARLRPVVEMLPVQMMSLALAAIVGREPGLFEHASKITSTE